LGSRSIFFSNPQTWATFGDARIEEWEKLRYIRYTPTHKIEVFIEVSQSAEDFQNRRDIQYTISVSLDIGGIDPTLAELGVGIDVVV
jgi:hypothetical protein